jgi:hypothetical protein
MKFRFNNGSITAELNGYITAVLNGYITAVPNGSIRYQYLPLRAVTQ